MYMDIDKIEINLNVHGCTKTINYHFGKLTKELNHLHSRVGHALETKPRGYKTCVQSQTQKKAQ